MLNYLWFLLAAVCEIAGCYAFWLWLRLDRSPWWALPGLLSLVVFALLLTRVEAAYAGRAYAAYGGIYVASSLAWLAWVERTRPSCDLSVGCSSGAFPEFWKRDPHRLPGAPDEPA